MLSDAARALAQARRRGAGQCVICGKPIEGLARKRYCSSTCRTRATRARQRQARTQTAPTAVPAIDTDGGPATGGRPGDRRGGPGPDPTADLADRDQDPEERP
jgi:predicted nucleic acid-binding Zn ribbon protein